MRHLEILNELKEIKNSNNLLKLNKFYLLFDELDIIYDESVNKYDKLVIGSFIMDNLIEEFYERSLYFNPIQLFLLKRKRLTKEISESDEMRFDYKDIGCLVKFENIVFKVKKRDYYNLYDKNNNKYLEKDCNPITLADARKYKIRKIYEI